MYVGAETRNRRQTAVTHYIRCVDTTLTLLESLDDFLPKCNQGSLFRSLALLGWLETFAPQCIVTSAMLVPFVAPE